MEAGSTNVDAGLERAIAHLRSLLVHGESLDAWAVQRRVFAFTKRRVIAAATSGRYIVLTRGLFGGFVMTDLRWQDVKDVKLEAGIFGATLVVFGSAISDLATQSAGPVPLMVTGLRKLQAQQVYRLAQSHEQAWREKRRVRELEELRAKSGGFHLSPGATIPAMSTSASQPSDAVSRLQQAKQLLDAKLISDSEYEAIKARVISGV